MQQEAGPVDDGRAGFAFRGGVAPGQPGDRGCPSLRTLSGWAEVAAQRHVGVQNGDQPIQVTGTAYDAESAARYGLERSRYEGPTGVVGVLHDACRRRGARILRWPSAAGIKERPLRSPWLQRRIPVELLLWPRLGAWTKVCLEPQRRVRLGRRYFSNGHRAIDALTARLNTELQKQ